MIITVRAKYWGAFMRTTLRSDLQQQQFTACCGQTKQPSRLEFALEIVLLLRINKVVLKIVLKMFSGCQGRMSGQAICPGQQQQGSESSSPCICKLKLEAGSMYFILILLSSPDGWADGTQAALWSSEDTGSWIEGRESGQDRWTADEFRKTMDIVSGIVNKMEQPQSRDHPFASRTSQHTSHSNFSDLDFKHSYQTW